MTHHILKCPEPYFTEIKAGRKTFEVRLNDRFYQQGDTVDLVRWDNRRNDSGHIILTKNDRDRALVTNEKLTFKIGPVLQGGMFGIKKAYCVFSLLPALPSVVTSPPRCE